MNWKVPRMWQGADVWILGGGPSVFKQFEIPPEVVSRVMSGAEPPSVYSPYMEYLHDKHVIGINVAYLIGDWISMVFFGDNRFYVQHRKELAKHPGLKVSSNPIAGKTDWVKYLAKENRKPKGISENPKTVCWNGNSGAAAISVAANAGAKRIILLGFDMSLDEAYRQHWHKLYAATAPKPNPKRKNRLPFSRHLLGFEFIAKDAKERGIEIINVCPESAITQFPKVNLKELLNGYST